MFRKQHHPFHIVTPSPWPFLISIAALITTVGATMYMHFYKGGLLILSLGFLHVVIILGLWWRDIIREGTFEGAHTKKVKRNLRLGFIFFIVSEIMFFFGFFWAFFHCALSPAISIGCVWPPLGIEPFDPLGTPLVNTLLLLLSGVTITHTHQNLLERNYIKTGFGFIFTLICAELFIGQQFKEYIYAPFAISDGIYGSVFYMITGLHGFHVIVGTIFIFVCLLRFNQSHFTRRHHVGFECAAWYWHFVDIVWLFVYGAIYWWGGF